jgi:LuxR family maltose regulon positive regulatory protein
MGYMQQMLGSSAGALRAWRQALASERVASSDFVTVALGNLCVELERRGQRRAAAALSQMALNCSTDQGGRLRPVATVFQIELARLELIANRLDLAQQHALAALDLCQRYGLARQLVAGKLLMARLLRALDRPDAALQHLLEARHLAAQVCADDLAAACAAEQADLQLAGGDLAAAERWAAELGCPDDAQIWCTVARLRLAQGRPQAALELLDQLECQAYARGHAGLLVTIGIWQCLAHAAADSAAAPLCLERAVRLAAGEDYLRPFLDAGAPIAERLLAARPVAPTFVDHLVDLFRAAGCTTALAAAPAAPIACAERLTERELDILGLMVAGLSYAEIAARLVISLNTVRFHVKNLYSKLAVHHRYEALARAREYHLPV